MELVTLAILIFFAASSLEDSWNTKAAALRLVDGLTTMRHSALMRLYILGAPPEKAAQEANTDIYNRRVTMRPSRDRR